MGHSWFMLVDITQCYVSFSCPEKWICCTYDFTLFWLSLYLTSPPSQFPLWILRFCPIFFTLGFSNIPLSIHTRSLRTLIQPQRIKCPRNLWDTLLTGMSVSPELQADVLSGPLFVPVWMVTTRISSEHRMSDPAPTATAKLTLSWVKIVLDLSDSASCSHPGPSFTSRSNPPCNVISSTALTPALQPGVWAPWLSPAEAANKPPNWLLGFCLRPCTAKGRLLKRDSDA